MQVTCRARLLWLAKTSLRRAFLFMRQILAENKSFHVTGRSSQRLLGYCPITKPRSLTALASMQQIRKEVLWHQARRFLGDAPELSRIALMPHGILQGILEPTGYSYNSSLKHSLNILTRNLARNLLRTKWLQSMLRALAEQAICGD